MLSIVHINTRAKINYLNRFEHKGKSSQNHSERKKIDFVINVIILYFSGCAVKIPPFLWI